MGHERLDQLVWLLDQSFEGDAEHSVLANLRNVGGLWRMTLPGGERSIAAIVGHVGACKYLYENHAFGDRSLGWDEAPGVSPEPQDEAIAWMREGHRRLRASVRALVDDEELATPRMTNWGEPMETRNIIKVLIQHDTYHAGEINHLRAMLQGNDRWNYFPGSAGAS